ncbi:MAG: hypothetical protein BMS9Abin01_2675 [Gammaproteobacteria bacterium]|nr:MAG: hypothetical protein BMS9Abin01_2675 [Gammaproteobacteria bacterium]
MMAGWNNEHASFIALFTTIESRDIQGAVDLMTRYLEKAREDPLGVV